MLFQRPLHLIFSNSWSFSPFPPPKQVKESALLVYKSLVTEMDVAIFQRYSWTGIQWDKLSLPSVSCTYRRLIYKEKRLFTSESVLTEDLVCLLNCFPVHPVQEAEKAIQCLNGKLALSKKLVVRWAHAQVKVSCLVWFAKWKNVNIEEQFLSRLSEPGQIILVCSSK